jgi:DNA-directed RNA polymerase sigma subunit (sigma70/sigma32)
LVRRSAVRPQGQRIRRIKAKALRKLKHPSQSRKLRSFLDE